MFLRPPPPNVDIFFRHFKNQPTIVVFRGEAKQYVYFMPISEALISYIKAHKSLEASVTCILRTINNAD